MAKQMVSVRLPEAQAAPIEGPALTVVASRPTKLQLEWLDKDGVTRPAGSVARPRAVHVETSSPDGDLGRAAATPPLRIPLDIPDGAMALQVRSGPEILARVETRTLRSPAPREPDRVLRLGAASGWRLAVVSERFDDEADFTDRCQALFEFICGKAPFNEPAVRDRFGVIGLFWASDPATGLFGAGDDRLNGRLLYGEENDVNAFVTASHEAANKTLVLINSRHRAGAGGFDGRRPSWSTITSAPGEQWEAIALHELGHAFGLADEYENPEGATPESARLEANVSKEGDPRHCSWAALVTVDTPPIPTLAGGGAVTFPVGAVGTFEGARYRSTGRYRPSPTCRMRATTSEFCPVCQEHIRQQLTTAATREVPPF